MSFIHPTKLRETYPFLAKKSLGQNFLVHAPVLETIARKVLEQKPHTLLEIGPGPGSLSQLLAPHCKRLVLIEKDEQFAELLREVVAPLGNVEIHMQDILRSDFAPLFHEEDYPLIAVGNLPYNISVAILKRLLSFKFDRLYLMFQREVSDRLTAKPSTKAYGSLSAWVQMLADLRPLLPIRPSAFWPRPKIESMVVEFVPLKKLRFDVDLCVYEKVIQAAFGQRRKTLANSLTSGFPHFGKEKIETVLKSAGIDPKKRAENLSVEEFARLAIAFQHLAGTTGPVKC